MTQRVYKVVLIDIDGVINHATRFSERYSAKYGVPIEKMLPFFKGQFQDCLVGERDLKEILPNYFEDWSWKGTVDELLDYWFAGEINPDKDVMQLIKDLHAKGVKTVGASNQERYRMNYLREALHLDDYMETSYSSAEVGSLKPEPEFYQYILNELAVKPEEVVYWDDDINNVASARDLGIKSYRFTNKQDFMRQFKECFPE